MKKLYLLSILSIVLILTSCASVQTSKPENHKVTKPSIDPLTVSFYNGKRSQEHPYHVKGKATVSQYNVVGIKRQEATIRDLMRQMAAKLGGNAVVDITHDDKAITGTVVEYNNQLVV